MSGMELPGAWTDLGHMLTRDQLENLLQYSEGVTGYLDGKPAAVILSVERYRSLLQASVGVRTS